MDEDLPFGSRGGIAVRHTFPLDGEYVIKMRLQRTYTEIIRGLAEPHRLEVRLDRGGSRNSSSAGRCRGSRSGRTCRSTHATATRTSSCGSP